MGRKVKFKSDKHRRAVFAAIAAKKEGLGGKKKAVKKLKVKRKASYELIKGIKKDLPTSKRKKALKGAISELRLNARKATYNLKALKGKNKDTQRKIIAQFGN